MKSKRGCVISLWHALLFFFMFFALEAFLLRRLLTDLRGGDLFGRYRYPLWVEYVPQIFTDFSLEVLVTQISQMPQIFFHRVFLFIGFHRFTQIFPASISFPSISFLHSHFSLLTSLSLFTFLPLKSLFTFLLFYLFTFKKAAAKK